MATCIRETVGRSRKKFTSNEKKEFDSWSPNKVFMTMIIKYSRSAFSGVKFLEVLKD
jgi:hypothetical protein